MEKEEKWFKQTEKIGSVGEWKMISLSKSKEYQVLMQKGKKVVDDTLYKYTWSKYWFPFAENQLGDWLNVSFDPEEYSMENPFAIEEIFVWYHDENRIAARYSNLDELMEEE